MHDGTDPEAVLAAVLAAPGVVEVHSRNIAYGCYMFAVTTAALALPGPRPSTTYGRRAGTSRGVCTSGGTDTPRKAGQIRYADEPTPGHLGPRR